MKSRIIPFALPVLLAVIISSCNTSPEKVDETVADTLASVKEDVQQIDGQKVGSADAVTTLYGASQVPDDDSVFDFSAIEQMPEYPGGIQKFYQYVGNNYKYPPMATEAGVSGRVTLQFIVEKDGSLSDIKVLKDLGFGTGNEAMRVLKKARKWMPGIHNGRPVRARYTLPIVLNLGQ